MIGGAAVEENADELPFSERARRRFGLALFALLAYVPLLLTHIGKLEADTKAYLFLDPGRLLSSAASMWDPSIGMGTVSYQTLGYLFPMGPFYWVLERMLGVPPWVTERLWLGSLILAAGLGTRYLLRTLGVRGPGVPVGVLAYAFTPYAIQFSSRTSVLLGPWAALPWMTAFMVLALRRGGWKYPALLAIAVQLAGSVNASTLIFALVAPALWVPYAMFVVGECDWRRALSVVWRTGLLVLVTSLWWMSALSVEAGYGLNILQFTETIKTTSQTTLPIELLRGLGYWFFYGKDPRSLWVASMHYFTQNPGVIFVSLLLPVIALVATVAVRWRYRVYFMLLVLAGVAIAVGTAPYSHPSPIGSVFQKFAEGSSVGLALRNSARAVPLVAFGLAVLLAALVSAAYQRLREHGRARMGLVGAVLVGALCLANAPGLWGEGYYSPYLEWRSIPSYWHQATRALDAEPHTTRVLTVPGTPFAAYQWGDVEDPIEPGLMTRPFIARQQVPEGSQATANLLQALDGRLQSSALDPNAVAPVARLMGVGDVLLDMDLQFDRFGLVPSDQLWNTFTAQKPAGLGAPQTFGTKIPGTPVPEIGNVARAPLASPPPLAVLPVDQPLEIVRTKPVTNPLVVDGDGEGIVDIASVGLLDARRLVLYSAPYEQNPAALRALASGATLIVTDSNRKRPRSSALVKNVGPTEQAGEQPLAKSVNDQRLDVFPGATDATRTVTVLRGVKSVQATLGSQPFSPISMRPTLAIDGNVGTAWLVDGAVAVGPERLRIKFDAPITTDHVTLVQPLRSSQGRWITKVSLSFDGHRAVRSDLGDASRSTDGQTIRFPTRTFSTLELRIEGAHHEKQGAPKNPVGFAEVRVQDNRAGAQPVQVQEDTRLPEDLLRALGRASIDHDLTFVISRDVSDDVSLSRQFSLPSARSFALSGTAVLSTNATDDAIDRRLGLPDATHGGVTATSSGRFTDPLARASSAIDGDLATAWNTPLLAARGSIEIDVPHTISFSHLDLHLVDDGRHSVPTRIRLTSDDGTTRAIDLTSVPHTRGAHGTVSVPVRFDAIRGRKFTFSISDVRPVAIKTAQNPNGALLPSAIAELGIPGVTRAPVPAQLPSGCVRDMLTIDGKPFPVRVTGSTADAVNEQPLQVRPCSGNAAISLGAGAHHIHARMNPDATNGLDISHLVLSSSAGGAAAGPNRAPPAPAGSGSADAPPVRVVRESSTSMTLQVDSAAKPFWLVLGQSFNRGWVAKANGHDLGKQNLVDGYANGWLVQPGAPGKPITISLVWTPARVVRFALPLSALAYLLCLAIVGVALVGERRRKVFALASSAPPALRRRLLPEPLQPRRRAAIGTAIAITAVGALLVTPWVGPAVGAVALLAIARPRWHRAVRLAPAVIVGAVGIYVTLAQIIRSYAPVIQWPLSFDAARIPTWIALLLLVTDGLIAIVWRTELDGTGLDGTDP